MSYFQDYRVSPGLALSLDARALARLEVREGTGWGTLEGDNRDYFMRSGESLAWTQPEGMFVVESIDPSVGLTVRVWTQTSDRHASAALTKALRWEVQRARRLAARTLRALARAIEPVCV